MDNPRQVERSRRHRRRTKTPVAARHDASGSHRHGHSHTPRLTRLYMSLPGNRGSDERILIGGAIAAVLILVVVGGWFMLNAPRDEHVSSASAGETDAVRFIGMTERNGLTEVRFEEHGQEFSLSLSSASPWAAEVRKARPGQLIWVPRRRAPLTEDDKTPKGPSPL